jgi:aminobenzoyl-glutamate utilization protein B
MSDCTAIDWVFRNQKVLTDISDAIWDYAETALREHRSSELMQKVLAENGFTVEAGFSGMATAFRAAWGSGKPVIGYLGEFDALPDLSQQAIPERASADGRKNGHGCGHNLLGTAALGAALALKSEMEAARLPGTVVFWGCPAEETMTGKLLMTRDGCFDTLDAAFSWHPSDINKVVDQTWLAMNTASFTFTGLTAHAAIAPERGRSALDAVELMNVGANYLREHVPSDVRFHYSVTDGGGQPNVVPDHAQSLYYVRAAKRETVDAVFERIVKVAKGAAMMTETGVDVKILTGCWHTLNNDTLLKLLHECMLTVPKPEWSGVEREFAHKLTASLHDGGCDCQACLDSEVSSLEGGEQILYGSTDLADVSWVTPVGQIMTCCAPIGTRWHSWQFAASAGMSIGHKGMLYAAGVLASAGSRLVREPMLLEKVRLDFEKGKEGKKYKCVIPEGVNPVSLETYNTKE